MQLIGMLDSPYVRRVAISMMRLGLPFQRHDWSVGADFDRIRQFSPLGRVPALVLDDGTVLVDSMSILDALDDLVGPSRALLPATGTPRREALRLMTLATGAAEKVARPGLRAHGPPAREVPRAVGRPLPRADARRAGRTRKGLRAPRPVGLARRRPIHAGRHHGGLHLDAARRRAGRLRRRRLSRRSSHTTIAARRLPEFQATRSKWFAAEMQK